MSAADLGRSVMDVLLEFAPEPDLGILLGAGASAGAGLPGWDLLARRLLTLSGAVRSDEMAARFLATQDPQLAAEAARASTDDWDALLQQALYGEGGEPRPTPLHLAAASLAAGRRNGGIGGTGLFTLNFDELIERAVEFVDADLSPYSRGAAIPRATRDQIEVHHLHGVLPPDGSSQGVVLTLSDFTALGSEPAPWQRSALQEQLQHGPLILAGTSYRDPDIRQWLNQLRHDAAHPIVLLLARAGLGLDRSQYAAVQDALIDQWEHIGVRALVTEDYADAAQALQEMLWTAVNGDADYLAPNERAHRLWAAHQADFAALQRTYSDQLATDADRLAEHLGPGANLTLWLADGTGEATRWASNDRINRSSELLFNIRPATDSDWIVGQALARDEIVALPAPASNSRRWQSVVAAPVIADLGGGPPLSVAALSSATTTNLDAIQQPEQDRWQELIEELSAEWAARLAAVPQPEA